MASGRVGDFFVVYTTEEGGKYKVAKTTLDAYNSVKELRQIGVHSEEGSVFAEPVFLALLQVIDNYDYIKGGPR